METLQDIKNTYAQERGYEDWEDLDMLSGRQEIKEHMDEICTRAQKAALEKAYERLDPEDGDSIYESITNPENLIR